MLAGWTQALDVGLMLAVGRLRPEWATPLMRAASVVGAGEVEIPLALLLSLRLALVHRRADAVGYASATLSGWAVYGLAKLVVHRARPRIIPHLMHGAGWYSFPSGHATLAPLVFGLGALLWAEPWPARTRVTALLLAALVTLLIGYSRIYVGVHWPSDVAGGYLLGMGWAALWVWRWEREGERVGPGGRA